VQALAAPDVATLSAVTNRAARTNRGVLTGATISAVFGIAWTLWAASGLAGTVGIVVGVVGIVLGVLIIIPTTADAVLDTPGVRSAHGTPLDDRGRRTLQLTVTVDPTADLPTVIAGTDHLCHALTHALGDPGTAARVHLRTARTTRNSPRVA